jgi:adenylate cyclase
MPAERLPPEEHNEPATVVFGGYPRALVESSLERVLASDVFRRSERHRRFMRHIVRAALDGQPERLKEVLLAIDLFDRKLAEYDPKHDPIVRVEAGRLRDKLARYYEREGSSDPFAFVIRVGSYVPQFERRDKRAVMERQIETFAVLPFASSGGRDEDAAFTVGLADQMINMLGRAADLKVVARVSAFKARDRNLEVRDIGRLLHVTRVIDGSIQRQGERMRCIAHIYRTRDGVVLWSQTFDSNTVRHPVDGSVDLFAFQDHIVEVVLAAASPSASVVADRSRPRGDPLVAPSDTRRARDLLDRARYLSRRYDATNTGKVIELLDQAVAIDDTNPQVHLALAAACIDEISLLNTPSTALLPTARKAARHALELDPRSGDAISMEGAIAGRFDLDWPRAERLFREALRIAPHAVAVNYRYAYCLILNGRFDEGLRHLRFALDLDPLNLGVRASQVHLLAYSRDFEGAMEEANAILELEAGHLYVHVVLGLINVYRGELDEGLKHFDFVIAALPAHPAARFNRICVLGLRGEGERGRLELDALLTSLADRHCPSFSLAMAYAGLRDRPRMYAALERAALERDPLVCSLAVDPLFEPFHNDPLFLALLERHGLRGPITATEVHAGLR